MKPKEKDWVRWVDRDQKQRQGIAWNRMQDAPGWWRVWADGDPRPDTLLHESEMIVVAKFCQPT